MDDGDEDNISNNTEIVQNITSLLQIEGLIQIYERHKSSFKTC